MVLGAVNGTEEDELARIAFIKLLVAVTTTPVLLFYLTLTVEINPWVDVDWTSTRLALRKEPILDGEIEL